MGEALVSGLIQSRAWKPSQITVTDVRPDQLERLRKTYKVRTSDDNRWAVRDAEIVLLAVKPQQAGHVLEEVGPVLQETQLVLSIVAGLTTAKIERSLAKGVPVIRVMANTPALIGKSASAIARGRWSQEPHEKRAQAILSTVGSVTVVPEKEMDAVTAVSGSGPAYVFYMAEAMMEAGVKLGLAPHVADALVRRTIEGAGALLAQSREGAATLRQRVTSPGGTTEAALKVLERARFKFIFGQALKRAAARSGELSRGM